MAGIGITRPIVLEKWTQIKKASGSNGEVLVTRHSTYAEVKRRNGLRSYQGSQTKMDDVYLMKIRKRGFDISGQYKVIYKGERLTVIAVEAVNEKEFYYSLTVEVK